MSNIILYSVFLLNIVREFINLFFGYILNVLRIQCFKLPSIFRYFWKSIPYVYCNSIFVYCLLVV